MTGMKLSRSKILDLINYYKKYECLWHPKSPDYKRSDIRKQAWNEIAAVFNTTADEVKKKVKYLRTAYVTEKIRVDASKKRGDVEIHEPKLFYYSQMSYLDSAIIWRRRALCISMESNTSETKESIQIEPLEQVLFEEDNTNMHSEADVKQSYTVAAEKKITQRCRRIPKALKIERMSVEDYDAGQTVNTYTRTHNALEQEDMFTLFGKSIGLQLRRLTPSNASRAMAQVQQIMSDYTIAHYQRSNENC